MVALFCEMRKETEWGTFSGQHPLSTLTDQRFDLVAKRPVGKEKNFKKCALTIDETGQGLMNVTVTLCCYFNMINLTVFHIKLIITIQVYVMHNHSLAELHCLAS